VESSLIRTTSHTRLRAHEHYTSSTLIGGKGGAGPSLLHTALEGPTEYISECKMDVKSTWIPTWHPMDLVSWSLDYFQKPSLGSRSNTKLGYHGNPNAHNNLFKYFIMCEDPHE
jgi:hypothetical protein